MHTKYIDTNKSEIALGVAIEIHKKRRTVKLPSYCDARDFEQEANLAALEAARDFDDSLPLKDFVARRIESALKRHLRNDGRFAGLDNDTLLASECRSAVPFWIHELLDQLPFKQAVAIEMKFFNNEPLREIARVLGVVDDSSVKRLIDRALVSLRKTILGVTARNAERNVHTYMRAENAN